MIDAVKEIIATEGTESISVRKVADMAGYSYATIYNYFADLNELLWYVTADYLDEIIGIFAAIDPANKTGPELFKEAYKTYVLFYLDNPAVYRFLFFMDLGPPPPKVAEKLQTPVLANMQIVAMQSCVAEGCLKEEEIPVVGDLLTGYIHGLLLLYFADRMQLNREILLTKLETTIDYFLGNVKGAHLT